MKRLHPVKIAAITLVLLIGMVPRARALDVYDNSLAAAELQIASLTQSAIELTEQIPLKDLYYDTDSFPEHIRTLIELPGITRELIDSLYGERHDARVRFTYIVILNQRIKEGTADPDATDVTNVLWNALSDPSPWVRTEAILGLGNLEAAAENFEDVIWLLEDSDTNVVDETLLALTKWATRHSGAPPVYSIDSWTDEEREEILQAWKIYGLALRESGSQESTDGGLTVRLDTSQFTDPAELFITANESHDLPTYARFVESFRADVNRLPLSSLELDGWLAKYNMRPIEWVKTDGSRVEYVKSPSHRSYSLLSFDSNGFLKAPCYGSTCTDHRDRTGKVVGTTQINLLWTAPWETNSAGHAIADALRDATGADVAFVNAYALRANIPAGPIRETDIDRMLPFGNVVTVVTLDGRDLLDIVRRGVDDRWFLYPSGITVEHNFELGIPSMNVRLTNGDQIDPAKTYRVAVPDYLANGGDLFTEFLSGKAETSGTTIREVFKAYIQNNPRWIPLNLPRVMKR